MNTLVSENLLNKIDLLGQRIGHTSLHKMIHPDCNLFAKMEFSNFSGSIKDRAAYWMMKQAILRGEVNEQTLIVESSSGNMAIALASICKILKLQFIPVIDPNINKDYESLLKLLTKNVIKVSAKDETGGYLLTRIKEVKKLCETQSNVYWPNQYENPDNWKAYYNTMAEEIIDRFKELQFIFIAVSSGGTITGLSLRLKEHFPRIRIIAVDIEGSVIFQNQPQSRYISGLGSSKVPLIINDAQIDDVIMMTHQEIIDGTLALLQEQAVFAGASSGACYGAVKKYKDRFKEGQNILFICPDRGYPYLDNVYKEGWLEMKTQPEYKVPVK